MALVTNDRVIADPSNTSAIIFHYAGGPSITVRRIVCCDTHIIKCVVANAGRIAHEQHLSQTCAIRKRILTNGGNAAANGYRSQITAPPECFRTDTDNTVRNDQNSQAGAALERVTANGDNGARNGHVRQLGTACKGIGANGCKAIGQFDARQSIASFKCAAANTGNTIAHGYIRQTVAAGEHTFANGAKAVANGSIGQTNAVIERSIANTGDTIGNRNADQLFTASERIVANAGNAIANRHANQAPAAPKCRFANADNIIRNDNAGQFGALIERTVANAGNAIANGHTSQIATVHERIITNADNVIRNINAGQLSALVEHVGSNTGNIPANGHAGQTAARIKDTLTHVSDTIGNHHTGQRSTVVERAGANGGDIVTNGHANQIDAPGKRVMTNGKHAVRNRHTGQAAAIIERMGTNIGYAAADCQIGQIAAAGDGGTANRVNTIGYDKASYAITIKECPGANAGYAVMDHNGIHTVPIIIPGDIIGLTVIIHLSRSADGQRTILGQRPGQVIAAGTGSDIVFGFLLPRRDIIRLAHGIFRQEFCREICFFRLMILKAVIAQQEPGIGHADLIPGSIPGGVQIVILIIQLHDIPGVTAAIANAGDDPGIHAQRQRQSVKQQRIALANSGFVDQSGIGREFQNIGFVIQIVKIIGNISAHIVINAVNLFIVGSIPQGKLRQKSIHSGIQRRFLGGIRIVRNNVLQNQMRTLRGGFARDSTATLVPLPRDIIALFGLSGVLHRHIPDLIPGSGRVALGQHQFHRDIRFSCVHSLAQSISGALQGFLVLGRSSINCVLTLRRIAALLLIDGSDLLNKELSIAVGRFAAGGLIVLR